MVDSSQCPDAPAGLHVEEVVVEPLVAGGVGLRPLRAVAEEPQPWSAPAGPTSSRGSSPRSTRNGAVARAIPTAAMLAGAPPRGLVRDQPVLGVDLVEVILEGHPLQGGEVAVAAGADFVQVDAPRSPRPAEVVPTSKGGPSVASGRDRISQTGSSYEASGCARRVHTKHVRCHPGGLRWCHPTACCRRERPRRFRDRLNTGSRAFGTLSGDREPARSPLIHKLRHRDTVAGSNVLGDRRTGAGRRRRCMRPRSAPVGGSPAPHGSSARRSC